MLAVVSSSPSSPLLLRRSSPTGRSEASPMVYRPPVVAVSSASFPTLERSLSMSHYAVLGIPMKATVPEIKSAYRRLARKCHPDVGGGRMGTSDGEFIRIHSAYTTLSDPEKRAAYDVQMITLRLRPPLSSLSSRKRYGVCGFPGRRNWETDQCWG